MLSSFAAGKRLVGGRPFEGTDEMERTGANRCVCVCVCIVLGAMSKSLATIVTQPLIVAKVGLQSKPPAVRNGKPFKSFLEVMAFVIEHEGPLGLFKGIGPQITKGLLVQGFLMMVKER